MEETKEKNEAMKQQTAAKILTKKSVEKTSSTEKKSVTKTTANVSNTITELPKTNKKITSRSIQKEKKLIVNNAVNKSEKTSKRAVIKKQNKAVVPIAEYYDLPYRYNQTIVKILAQTPHSLFIYWDISDDDRLNLIEKYGDTFFNETKPVLLVHNQTLNSSFEIEVDDFTNSWYLKTPTSNCVFNIELGRKKITKNPKIDFGNSSNILHIATSNVLESPNDHVLRKLPNKIYFKNVITNQVEVKKISNKNQKNISSIIGLYQDNNEYEHNPSSGFNMFQVI
ncbi:MAG: DUF4912 domain-containing protein [Clostridia bacterium]|nr:DUF4912 domain-containing protein [Clostridia bacterium]